MNKTSKLVALIAIALLMTLSGCKLPASQKPAATATPTELGFHDPQSGGCAGPANGASQERSGCHQYARKPRRRR